MNEYIYSVLFGDLSLVDYQQELYPCVTRSGTASGAIVLGVFITINLLDGEPTGAALGVYRPTPTPTPIWAAPV